MKNTIVLFLTSLLFVSCSDEQVTNPINNPLENATIGVKVKRVYPTLESTHILSLEEYDYNSANKLQKISSYGGDREILYCYDEYGYDVNGLPVKRIRYHSNINAPSGFVLLKSTTYSHSDGLLLTERTTFPQANYFEEYMYEYKDRRLILKSFYHNGSYEDRTVYEYDGDKLRREIVYSASETVAGSIDYIYTGNVLTESKHYATNGDLLKRISYSYNQDGKLIIEDIEVIAIYSSTLPNVVRYEY